MDDDYKEFLKALGARIKTIRKVRGLSLRDMVVLHGYHDSQWRKYESGGGLTVQSMLRIAKVLKLTVCELVDGLEKSPMMTNGESKKKKKSTKRAKR
jgi:transcriptional regulator with XRE-family HTH domain